MSEAYETIRVEARDGGVLLVTLDRPASANAFNTRMAEELAGLWTGLAADPGEARCVVLTGAGARAFSAGADLKERLDMPDADWRRQHEVFEAMAYAIMRSALPTIAAVNGAAIGGGFELVLACDFAYAANTARFAFTEVRLGIMPGIGGTQNLPRAVGLARAREILMTGARVSAEQALDWGLVNRLCQPETLVDEALETARRIAANAPLAVVQARRAAAGALDLPLEEGLALELACYNTLVDSEDRKEGIRAYNEKRTPVFRGR
jgi:enoyl-CoA hydratase/carnithine racemase